MVSLPKTTDPTIIQKLSGATERLPSPRGVLPSARRLFNSRDTYVPKRDEDTVILNGQQESNIYACLDNIVTNTSSASPKSLITHRNNNVVYKTLQGALKALRLRDTCPSPPTQHSIIPTHNLINPVSSLKLNGENK